MYEWICDLFPINRSITGEGVRQTLKYIKKIVEGLEIKSVRSGTDAYDWKIPKEWIFKRLLLKNSEGVIIIDSNDSNLHVVGYSKPIKTWLDWKELEGHIHTCRQIPNAIPYVTSYYKEAWGICMSETQKSTLGPGSYHVEIDSELVEGVLNYGELFIKRKNN